jgi:hypothetical protein
MRPCQPIAAVELMASHAVLGRQFRLSRSTRGTITVTDEETGFFSPYWPWERTCAAWMLTRCFGNHYPFHTTAATRTGFCITAATHRVPINPCHVYHIADAFEIAQGTVIVDVAWRDELGGLPGPFEVSSRLRLCICHVFDQ